MPYKTSQFVQIDFPTNAQGGNTSFEIDSSFAVDRIRISVSSNLAISTAGGFKGCMSVYTNLINNYIGTIANNFVFASAGYNIYSDEHNASDGITVFLPYRTQVSGRYDIQFRYLDGSVPTNVLNDVFLLVEYYQDD